jgi:hypothetical protein
MKRILKNASQANKLFSNKIQIHPVQINRRNLSKTCFMHSSSSITENSTVNIIPPQPTETLLTETLPTETLPTELLTESSFDQVFSTFAEAGLTTLARTGFNQYYPTGVVEHIYQFMIENNEIGWLAGIPLVTVLIRGAIIPLQLRNQKKLKEEMWRSQSDMMRLREEQLYEIDENRKNEIEYEIHAVRMQQANPMPMILRMVPTAVVMSSHFIALRNIADSNLSSINTTHLPWADYTGQLEISSLALSDPLFILPATASALTVYSITKGFDETIQNMPPQSIKLLSRLGQGLGLITFLLVSSQSATVSMMFATNAVISICVGRVMKMEASQKALGTYRDPVETKILTDFMKIEMDRQMKELKQANLAREQTKVYEELAQKRIKERHEEGGDWK